MAISWGGVSGRGDLVHVILARQGATSGLLVPLGVELLPRVVDALVVRTLVVRDVRVVHNLPHVVELQRVGNAVVNGLPDAVAGLRAQRSLLRGRPRAT
eukprot:1915407-Lingulodinium_polyedra.AAC.1